MRNTATFLLMIIPGFIMAQTVTQDSSIKRKAFGLSIQKGAVFIHKPSVASAKDAYPRTVALEFSTHSVDYASFSICRTYFRRGFSFLFTDYNTPILGYGFITSYFLEPAYRIGKRFQFQFRGDAGLGYFTAPYDEVKNNTNQSYSTRFTPYLHVGSGFGVRISNKITAEVNGNFNHISNGHFKQPNAGLNWIMLSASVLYYPENNLLPKYKYVHTKRTNTKPSFDVGTMFVPRQGYHERWHTRRNYMVGLFTQISQPVSRINAITLGAEVSYNRFVDGPNAPKNNSRPALTAGIHIGHEFLMGKIIFSQQIGKYFTKYPSFVSGIYHRWGLRYQLNKHWFAGFNMKAHKEAADLIDLRLQYRF